jgi:hypothetical protein
MRGIFFVVLPHVLSRCLDLQFSTQPRQQLCDLYQHHAISLCGQRTCIYFMIHTLAAFEPQCSRAKDIFLSVRPCLLPCVEGTGLQPTRTGMYVFCACCEAHFCLLTTGFPQGTLPFICSNLTKARVQYSLIIQLSSGYHVCTCSCLGALSTCVFVCPKLV